MLRVFLQTYGCQMNERDSEHVIAQFLDHGYALADAAREADVILLNTCSVRQHAEDKVFSELGRLRKLKSVPPKFAGANLSRGDDYPTQKIIGVIGCMAENLKDKIIKRMPQVDLVCGPNDLGRIVELVENVQKTHKDIIAVGAAQRDASFYRHLYQADNKHSYVVIMEGCNNFCSYCVVPYVRGRERSRAYRDIVGETKTLVRKGIVSLTLLGQNVNSYSGGCSFPELLRKVSAIEGVKEINFATSHPKDASIELFEAMRDCPNIRKYLHLPLQSGSNRILKAMNRGYTRAHYTKLVKEYRAIVGKDANLGTDFILGFPAETEKDFKDTLTLAESIRFDFAYIFKYSPRPNTKAAKLDDDVPMETKQRRHQALLELQRKISKSKK